MGEGTQRLFAPTFNGSIWVEGRPERLTGDAGGMLLRETMEQLGIVSWLVERLDDPRKPELITHPLEELLRTSVALLGQGWRDHDDADFLRDDAVLRLSVSNRRGIAPLAMRPRALGEELAHNPEVPDGLASQPTLSRLTRALSSEKNRAVLREGLMVCAGRRIRAMNGGKRLPHLTLDVDSLPIEVHGSQPGSAYNGHYHARVYHPIIANAAETGDALDLHLREGSVHTAEGALDFILPLLNRAEEELCEVASLRIDAGFPADDVLDGLEARGTKYVARIRNNPVLDRMAEPDLRRPVGRRPKEPRAFFYERTYRAESWSKERRVVLVVLEREDDLFLHHFWLITDWTQEEMSAEALLDLYRDRGTAEGHYGELMSVLDPALSSSPRPKSLYDGEEPVHRYPSGDSFDINEVRLLLNLLAYNVVHAARVAFEQATGEGVGLRRFRERLLRVAGRVLVHSNRAILVLAAATAVLWAQLWPALSTLRAWSG
jgi:hypothetical protein